MAARFRARKELSPISEPPSKTVNITGHQTGYRHEPEPESNRVEGALLSKENISGQRFPRKSINRGHDTSSPGTLSAISFYRGTSVTVPIPISTTRRLMKRNRKEPERIQVARLEARKRKQPRVFAERWDRDGTVAGKRARRQWGDKSQRH